MDSAIGSPHTPTAADMGMGLQAIYRACYRLYPNQPSPLQVTALRKFWMGGPDPLDYIYMFSNPGSADARSPAHWHYVTNGLSDLYGDARLHNCTSSTEGPSGFGFELTFRLRREPGEKNPPTWPAHLLQSLARYVFRSQAQLLPGDHIPWHCSLDELPSNGASNAPQKPNTTSAQQQQQQQQSVAMAAVAASLIAAQSASDSPLDPNTYSSALAAAVSAATAEYQKRAQPPPQTTAPLESMSRIRHMLLVDDPQLMKITTPYGWVRFLQIVGLCDEELRLVQRWTGGQVADIFRGQGATGGALLVTDMRRRNTIFELETGLASYINERMAREGSNLSGVTTQYFAWAAIDPIQMADCVPGEQEALIRMRKKGGKKNKMHLTASMLPSSAASGHPPDSSASTAMETDDSGSVTTLHQASSSVARAKPGGSGTDDEEIIDVVGDGGSSVKGNKLKAIKTEAGGVMKPEEGAKPNENEDAEMAEPGGQNATVDLSMADRSKGEKEEEEESKKSASLGEFSLWDDRTKSSNPLPFRTLSKEDKKSTDSKNGHNFGSCDALLGGTDSSVAQANGGSALGFTMFDRHRSVNKGSSSAGAGRNALVPSYPFAPGMSSPSGGSGTPGSITSLGSGGGYSGGGESAPCTPLAHLSLSPASLELLPSSVIDCLDVHLSLEAGELLPLAICDRLKHGRHFTFLNANSPEHAITLVPPGVTGAMVSGDVPFVSRGPWLQIYLPKDFLEQLERQFSILQYPEDIVLPIVFRWPERRLRICLLDAGPSPQSNPTSFASSVSAFHSKAPTPGSAPPHFSTSASTIPADIQPIKSGFSQVPPYASPTNTPGGFPHFPPGCIPPPPVIAAFINSAASSASNYGRKPNHGVTSPTGSLSASGRSQHGLPDGLPYTIPSPNFPYHGKLSPASAPGFHSSANFPPQFSHEASKPLQSQPTPSANTFSPAMLEAMQTMITSLSGLYRFENNNASSNNKRGTNDVNPFGFPSNPNSFPPHPDQPHSRPPPW